MCGSCIDESTTSSDSISNALTSAPATTPNTKLPPESRCCIGSGTSVILDAEVGVEAESRKLPSSKYKGVVPQPNGRWGAQIYEKHQRVWLGTFNEESEAAKAYDVAVQRFRGRDAVTNLKVIIEDEDEVELMFLNSHSKSEIVDMLRKHTYNDELEQSRKKMNMIMMMDGNNLERKLSSSLSYKKGNLDKTNSTSMKVRENLFEKAVTPSDVGKLNRLVIPKQHAEKHFPLGGSGSGNNTTTTTTTTKGVLLNFEDVTGKVWRFRYSYWNSSQSYVLTKGWSRFVKEKNLKAGDIVMFQKSSGQADDHNNKQLYIDWKQRNGNGNSNNVSIPSSSTVIQIPQQQQQQPVKMFRLFGVNIVNVPGSNVNVVCNNSTNNICTSSSGKRGRDIQLLEKSECIKKPKAINAL